MKVFVQVAVFSIIFGCAIGENIVELAGRLGANILLEFVKTAGIEEALETGGNFTVFAPTDDAFEALPRDVVEKLKSDKALLTEVLKFHVIKDKIFKKSLEDELLVPTLNKKVQIRINYYEDKKIYTATGSVITTFDHEASNGVIHVIDKVMYPLPTYNIVSDVIKNKDLHILEKAVTLANLQNTLSGKGPFTLFAPTDAAFEALPRAALAMLLKNITALTELLTYHVVPGTDYSAGLSNGMKIRTENGKDVKVKIDGGNIMVNTATVVKADIPTSNGVIHMIDSVLCPRDNFRKQLGQNLNLVQLAEKLGANILVKLLKDTGLDKSLTTGGNFTMFAPTDKAFEVLPAEVAYKLKSNKTLLTEVLKFHVIEGRVLKKNLKDEVVVPTLNKQSEIRINYYYYLKVPVYTVTGSVIATFDQEASNGVIHVIDRVMFPLPTDNLVSTLSKNKDFNILVHAIKLAKLADKLSEKGPFTMFAPDDSAFERLPCGALALLLKNITALTEVLTYHVVHLTYYSAGFSNNELKIQTLNGKDVEVIVIGGKAMVNQANVIKADTATTNGVFHKIDSVLLPTRDYFRKRPNGNMLFKAVESARKMYGRRF